MEQSNIDRFFAQTPLLALLCSQNGWPDSDSLTVEVVAKTPSVAACSVSFDEIVVEGAGCVAARVACWGRFDLTLDDAGQVLRAERVA